MPAMTKERTFVTPAPPTTTCRSFGHEGHRFTVLSLVSNLHSHRAGPRISAPCISFARTAGHTPATVSTEGSGDGHGSLRQVCPDIFAALYSEHWQTAVSAARRFFSQDADREDAAQEAFARLLASAPRTGIADPADPWPAGKTASYVRTAVTNLCVDRYRTRQRRPDPLWIDDVPETALPPSPFPDPSLPLLRQETAGQVRSALGRISTAQADALVLREVLDTDLPEIADRLGIQPHKCKHLLLRARRSLRRELAADGHGQELLAAA